MKRLSSLVAGGIGLACFVLLATPEKASAQQAVSSSLSQQANDVLGLSRSSVGDVRVIATTGTDVRVGVSLAGSPILMDLSPHSVRAGNFTVRAQLEDGSWITMPAEPVRTYRGALVADPGSQVAASLLNDGLHARVRTSGGQEYWIEPLAPHLGQASSTQHVLYRTDDVLDQGATCDADLLAPIVAPGSLTPQSFGQGGKLAASVTAEVACDADYEYFSAHGSGTQARIESVINSVNVQYDAEVGISHSITAILIRTSSNDPYTKKPAEQLLNEFRAEWNANQSGIQRDVAHLFTGRNLAGSTIGIAWVGTVCNLNLAYSLVESDFASSFACVTDLSAHELGHNWGAGHCSCSGFTMNPSITCANTFSPSATIPVITAYRDAQSCFGPPPATGSVAGVVTSSAGGAAIAGATVQVDTGQSATTNASGSYSIADVPTGSRTVTASATGFDAQNSGATVNENSTTTVDFALDPAPVGSQAVVDCITYRSTGGPNSDRNLFIDVTIVDDGGSPVSGASVSVSVDLNGASFGTASGTTDSSGEVTFQAKNSPNGCYETDVTGVSAAGLSFDGSEPLNGFAKGSDSTPDADCRSGSDACGAG